MRHFYSFRQQQNKQILFKYMMIFIRACRILGQNEENVNFFGTEMERVEFKTEQVLIQYY